MNSDFGSVSRAPDDTTHLLEYPPELCASSRAASSSSPAASNKILALGVIVTFLFIWVTQSELVQAISTGGIGEAYEKPGFICYVNHNAIVFFFPIACALRFYTDGVRPIAHLQQWAGRLGLWRAFWLYSSIAVVYAICIWAWVYGLIFISVTASNGIYQLNSVFAVLLSWIVLEEKFTFTKKVGVILSFLGIVVVVLPPMLQDKDKSTNPLLGSILTVFSAITWAGYEVCYSYATGKKNSPTAHLSLPQSDSSPATHLSHSRPSPSTAKLNAVIETMTTLSIIGVGNLLFVPPFLVLLHFTGVEPFELPSTESQIYLLSVNAFLSFLFDLTFALAIYLSGPVVVSVSSSLIIPLSFVADFFLHDKQVNPISVAGSVIVMAGLFSLNDDGGHTEKFIHSCFGRPAMKVN